MEFDGHGTPPCKVHLHDVVERRVLAPAPRERAGAVPVLVLAACLTLLACMPVNAASNAHHAVIRPLARLALDQEAHGRRLPSKIAPALETKAGPVYGIFIGGQVTRAEISATGAIPGTVLSVGATARGTLRQLMALADLPGANEVDIAPRPQKLLDQSVPTTHAAEPGHAATAGIPHMWSGTSPGFAGETGAGTVVGVVDSGIDIQNPDFQTPTGTRIKYLWDQAASGSLPTPPFTSNGHQPGGGYGQECVSANIDATNGLGGGPGCGPFTYGVDCNTPGTLQSLPEIDCDGHGTHVAGIAASDGRASRLVGTAYSTDGATAGTYIGMAPQADIVYVKTDFQFLTDVVDGVNYIFQKAATIHGGEPASVNLSIGTGVGPHDGTSLFETMLDALTGSGKLLSVAAGNFATGGSGSVYYHSSLALAASATSTNSLRLGIDPALFDIWYPSGHPFSLRVQGPGGVDTGFVSQGTSTGTADDGTCNGTTVPPVASLNGNGDEAIAINCTSGTAGSGDGEAQFVIFNPNTGGVCPSSPCTGTWSFTIRNDSASTGTFNAWAAGQSDYLISGAPGNDSATVAPPATAHNVISVGSWNDRRVWPGQGGPWMEGGINTLNDHSHFSSIGPTRDGRQGIDITAPGEMIGSSLSAHANPGILSGCGGPAPDCTSLDGAHLFIEGTSMAAPHVAGALALLQHRHALTPTAAKQMLAFDAVADGFTGAVPNTSWGSGKLSLTDSLVSASPATVPADNATTSTVSVTVRNSSGAALVGKTVSLTQLAGPGLPTIGAASGVSDGSGLVTFSVKSATTGSDSFYATDTTDDVELGTVVIVFTGQYIAVAPTRILDTRADGPRAGLCPTAVGQCVTVGSGGALDIQVTGQAPVPPTGVFAVILNVTVTRTTAPSYLTVYPTGGARPLASSLDWSPGETLANLVEVPIGTNGRVTVFNFQGSTDVLFDVAGYVTNTAAAPLASGLFHPLAPQRIADSRPTSEHLGTLSTFGSDSTQTLNVAPGTSGLPPADGTVAAVVLNVTVVNNTGAGYLTLWPHGAASKPVVSNLDWAPGSTTVNRVVVTVGTLNSIDIYNFSGNADVIIDVGGWFSGPTASGTTGAYNALAPNRILDTRDGTGQFSITSPGDGSSTITMTVAGRGGVPLMSDPVVPSAVVLNVTVTDTNAGSFLTVFPSDVSQPLASDIDWASGVTVANMVVVKLGSDGKIKLFNHAGTVDVIVDLQGWYS